MAMKVLVVLRSNRVSSSRVHKIRREENVEILFCSSSTKHEETVETKTKTRDRTIK